MKLHVEINLDGAAYRNAWITDELGSLDGQAIGAQLARIARDLDPIDLYHFGATMQDVNGNTCGRMWIACNDETEKGE